MDNCAFEVLTNYGINPVIFAAALCDLLQNGRGKCRSIVIVGSANCGKTFMLSPFQTLFKTFSNPAHDNYAWRGVDEAECIFLSNFRWSNDAISWNDFLPLLEGHEVHLPSPKNQYARDLNVKDDVPIFAKGKERIMYVVKYVAHDERETEMMLRDEISSAFTTKLQKELGKL